MNLILGTTADGAEVFYTGRAGDGWVSADVKEAFRYDSLEQARRKAMIFNQATPLHGIRFMVPCGERTF